MRKMRLEVAYAHKNVPTKTGLRLSLAPFLKLTVLFRTHRLLSFLPSFPPLSFSATTMTSFPVLSDVDRHRIMKHFAIEVNGLSSDDATAGDAVLSLAVCQRLLSSPRAAASSAETSLTLQRQRYVTNLVIAEYMRRDLRVDGGTLNDHSLGDIFEAALFARFRADGGSSFDAVRKLVSTFMSWVDDNTSAVPAAMCDPAAHHREECRWLIDGRTEPFVPTTFDDIAKIPDARLRDCTVAELQRYHAEHRPKDVEAAIATGPPVPSVHRESGAPGASQPGDHKRTAATVQWVTRAGNVKSCSLFPCCGQVAVERNGAYFSTNRCSESLMSHSGHFTLQRMTRGQARNAAHVARWNCCSQVLVSASSAPVMYQVLDEPCGCCGTPNQAAAVDGHLGAISSGGPGGVRASSATEVGVKRNRDDAPTCEARLPCDYLRLSAFLPFATNAVATPFTHDRIDAAHSAFRLVGR